MTFRSLLLLFFASRVWLAIFAYAGHLSHPFQEEIEGGYAGVSSWWLNVWTYFDSEHFLAIAREGYTAKTSAFFPLYPLLLRPFGPDENAMALAGVLFSNLAFGGALWLFSRVVARDYGEKIASPACFALAFFPMGVASIAVYTESLFLLLGLGAWWMAGEKRWLACAILAFGAALTRNSGPILFLALSVWWWQTRRETKSAPPGGLIAAFAPLGAFIGMQIYFRQEFAGASTLGAQGDYLRALGVPLAPLAKDLALIFSGRDLNFVLLLNVAATIAALALPFIFRKKLRAPDAILLLGVMLLHLTIARIIPPYTNGSLRYVFALWPFSILLGLVYCGAPGLQRPRVRGILVAYALATSAAMAFAWGQKSFLG